MLTYIDKVIKMFINGYMLFVRAGARAVDLGGPSFNQGGEQSLKLSTKAAVFKREILLIGGGEGGQTCQLKGAGLPGPFLAPALLFVMLG